MCIVKTFYSTGNVVQISYDFCKKFNYMEGQGRSTKHRLVLNLKESVTIIRYIISVVFIL
jgi:hypothetical protein